MMLALTFIETPLGQIAVAGNDTQGIYSIAFVDDKDAVVADDKLIATCVENAARQLAAYFDGKLTSFDLPLYWEQGTVFQQKVWKQLIMIPFGTTCSYLQLAQQLGDAKAVRAVGLANGKNPFAIVVPCHRVIGSNRQLVGYAGGLERKHQLLHFEKAIPQGRLFI